MDGKKKMRFPGGGFDFGINRFKLILMIVFWGAALAIIAYVFMFKYLSLTALAENQSIPEFFRSYGDEMFLGLGIALAAMILVYLVILLNQLWFKGPIYRITEQGLHFMQAGDFIVPKSAIHAISFKHNTGLATSLVIEIWEKDQLLALSNRLARFANATVSMKERAVTISLTELKKRTAFISALDALSDRVRY